MTSPEQQEQFDRFYKDVRTRLLLLTYCLTGDLPSSRAAVRDGFVVAWHHWRKVSRLEDPESWVRERACRDAQRRHTAKLWHREKGPDPEAKDTLDALGRLSMSERRVLLVAELTTGSLENVAREVGLPRAEAERKLQAATSSFALERGVPTTRVRALLEQVGAHVEGVRLPRPSIVRRAGATRRRTHTVVGVAATVAALVVTGTLVTDNDGVRPTLAGERVTGDDHAATAAAEPPVTLSSDDLLGVAPVARLAPKARWTITGTDDNSTGSGLRMACQRVRYAGPRLPTAAIVRTFDADGGRGGDPKVVQAVEAARTERAAERAFDTAVGWFAACRSDRPQLLATYDVPGLGDDARVLELRTWNEPRTRIVAGVARTGRFTTVTFANTLGDGGPDARAVARVLAGGVDRICHLPGGGTCGTQARARAADPVPVATAPAMLAEIDLPPVRGIAKPWVGTEPRKALDNAAATNCDGTDFGAPMRDSITRTFLVPEAKLPTEFGLTESIGTLPQAKAQKLVSGVRDRMAGCSKKQMGTDVTRLRDVRRPGTDLSVWRVKTEVTDDRSISFLMGIVRDGGSVAQVGFVPAGARAIGDRDFEALVQRALDRLSALG